MGKVDIIERVVAGQRRNAANIELRRWKGAANIRSGRSGSKYRTHAEFTGVAKNPAHDKLTKDPANPGLVRFRNC